MSKKINYLIDAVTQSTKYMVSGARFGLREAKWGLLADYKGKNYHIGVDYGTPVGTPLYAPDTAEVVMCDATGKGAYGKYVMLYLPYQTVSIHLAHMNKIDVKLGQKVNKGTKVGTSGNTGLSSGPHLHLGLASGRKTNLNKGSYGDKTWLNPSTYDFQVKPKGKFSIGDTVYVKGQLYKNSSASEKGSVISERKTKITRFAEGAKAPYNTTGDLGWVKEEQLSLTPRKKSITEGSRVSINGTRYATGERIPFWVKTRKYTVQKISNDRVLLKEIQSWVNIKDIKL